MGFSALMPPVDGKRTINYVNALNKDIISVIESRFPEGVKQVGLIAEKFRGSDNLETAKKIWEFLRTKITYKKDDDKNQNIRMPNRFIADRHHGADCKSFSLFTASILGALKMPVNFRYASYTDSPIPTHVYVTTADENGREIIVDGVYKYFNKEAKYTFIKNNVMTVSTLSGPFDRFRHRILDRLPLPPSKIAKHLPFQQKVWHLIENSNPGSVRNLLLRELHHKLKGLPVPVFNYTPWMVRNMVSTLAKYNADPTLSKTVFARLLREKLQELQPAKLIETPLAPANVSGIGRRHRKGGRHSIKDRILHYANLPALLPARRSLLTLIAINAFSLAYKFNHGLTKNKKGLERAWYRMGGNPKFLEKSTRIGIYKKPILGGKRKDVQKFNGIGIAPAAIPALIAAAGTLLAFLSKFTKGGKDPKTGAPLDDGAPGSLSPELQMAAQSKGSVQALTRGVSTLLDSPAVKEATDKLTGKSEEEVDREIIKAEKTHSDVPTSVGFKPSPMLIGGAALLVGGILFMANKKRK